MNPVYRKSSTSRVMSDGTTETEEVEESFTPPDSHYWSQNTPVYSDMSSASSANMYQAFDFFNNPNRTPMMAEYAENMVLPPDALDENLRRFRDYSNLAASDASRYGGGASDASSSGASGAGSGLRGFGNLSNLAGPSGAGRSGSSGGGLKRFGNFANLVGSSGTSGSPSPRGGLGVGMSRFGNVANLAGASGSPGSAAGGGMGFAIYEDSPAQSGGPPCGTSPRSGLGGGMQRFGNVSNFADVSGMSSGASGGLPSPPCGGIGKFTIYEDSPAQSGSPRGTSPRGGLGGGLARFGNVHNLTGASGSPGGMPTPAGGGMGFAIYEDSPAQGGGPPCGTSPRSGGLGGAMRRFGNVLNVADASGSPGRMPTPAGGGMGFAIYEDSPAQSGGTPRRISPPPGGLSGASGSSGRMPTPAGGGMGFAIYEDSPAQGGGPPCGTSPRSGGLGGAMRKFGNVLNVPGSSGLPGRMPAPAGGGMGFAIYEDSPAQSGGTPRRISPSRGGLSGAPRRFGNVLNLPGASGLPVRMPLPAGGGMEKFAIYEDSPAQGGGSPNRTSPPPGNLGGGMRRFGNVLHLASPYGSRATTGEGDESYNLPPPRRPRYRMPPAQESPMVVGRDLRMDSPVGRFRSPSPSSSPMSFAPNLTSTPMRQRPQPVGDFSNSRIETLALSHQNEINELHEGYRAKLASARDPGERQQIEERYKQDLHSKQHIHNLEMEALACRIRDASNAE